MGKTIQRTKTWALIAGVVLILFGSAYLLTTFYAIRFIESQVQKGMGPGLTIAKVRSGLTHLAIVGIQWRDPEVEQTFLQIEKVKIYPDVLSFAKRSVSIRELTLFTPSLFFYRTREGDFVGPWISSRKEGKGGDEEGFKGEKKVGETIPVKIDRLLIAQGSVAFEDRNVDETPAKISLKEIELIMERMEFPSGSVHSFLELKGNIIGKGRTGSVWIKGWVNLKTSDLEISLNLQDVDLTLFCPYYRRRVSAEVKSGTIGMESQIAVKKGVLEASGKLQLSHLEMGERGTLFFLPAKRLQAHIKERGNRIEIPFHLKGDLKDPRLPLQEIFLRQIGFGLAKALGFSIQAVEGERRNGVDKERMN